MQVYTLNDFRNSRKTRDQFDCAAADAELPLSPQISRPCYKPGVVLRGGVRLGDCREGPEKRVQGNLARRTSPEGICDAQDPRSALTERVQKFLNYREACIWEQNLALASS